MVPDVCKLELAIASEYPEPQTHYVEFPFRPGLQPCLIEFTKPNQTVGVAGTVALLPSDAPFSAALSHETYARYLILIRSEFSHQIRRAFCGNPMFESWDDSSVDQPPFRDSRLLKLSGCVDAFLSKAKSIRQSLPGSFASEVAALEKANRQAAIWEPQHFWAADIAKRLEKNWWIIQNWADWNARGLGWSDRFREYAARFEVRVPQRDRQQLKRAKDPFVKRCRFLGLPEGAVLRRPPRRSKAFDPASW